MAEKSANGGDHVGKPCAVCGGKLKVASSWGYEWATKRYTHLECRGRA